MSIDSNASLGSVTKTPAGSPRTIPRLRRGSYEVEFSNLPSFMRDAARHHANRAVTNASRSASEFALLDAAISVGSAIELTAKALIATLHPSLIVKTKPNAEAQAAHGMLVVIGHPGLERPAFDFQTIDASVAVALVRHLKLGPEQIEVKRALDVRNLAVHLSVVDQSDLNAAVGQMTAYVNAALPRLNLSDSEFWGASATAAHDAFRLHEIRTKELANSLVTEASNRFTHLYGEIPEPQRTTLIQSTLEGYDPGGDSQTELECPACESNVAVGMEMDWDIEKDGDSYVGVPTGPVVLDFHCPVCALDLTSEELDAIGIPTHELLQSF